MDLHWSTPSETTDRLKLRQPVQLRICRQINGAACQTAATISAAPGKPADYTDILPAALTTGPLRTMTYEIFGLNRHGRSAGPSNPAETLAGEAPAPVQNFSARMMERGVLLHWQAIPGLPANTSVQLQRKLLTTAAPTGSSRLPGGLPPVAQPVEQILQVPPEAGQTDPGTVLDTGVVFNREYRYVAIRVTARKTGTQLLQVVSAPSTPAVIFTRDTFPPAIPAGLAAVPVPASLNGGTPEVDLSWSANMEPDFSHYLVYRRDVASQAPAEQIAPETSAAPIVAPAFRDTDVQPGHTYAYSVAAVDNAGNKSACPPEVMVTIPSA